MQQIFLKLLLEEKKKGTTIFLSSHVLSEVEKICDRVALIRDGVISFVFKMNEINKNEHKKVSLSPKVLDSELEGLVFTSQTNSDTHYDYKGDINKLVKFISQHKFKNITIRDASLEEIVLKYYKKEE